MHILYIFTLIDMLLRPDVNHIPKYATYLFSSFSLLKAAAACLDNKISESLDARFFNIFLLVQHNSF